MSRQMKHVIITRVTISREKLALNCQYLRDSCCNKCRMRLTVFWTQNFLEIALLIDQCLQFSAA